MSETFLRADGTPDVECLLQSFNRATPPVQGGLQWLDAVRDCNGPGDSADGRKHSNPNDPDSEAFPWEGASNCKPFTADDVINELSGRDIASFWRAMIQQGVGTTEEATYAVALIEHLVFGPMMAQLDKEVELSAQHRHSRGWCVLAPRWRTKFSMKHYLLKLEMIQALADAAVKGGQPDNLYSRLLLSLPDPTQDDQSAELLKSWHGWYIRQNIPKDYHERVPELKTGAVRRIINALRSDGEAKVAIPYICRNEAEIVALEPWREVVIPNEVTDVQTVLFHIEFVSKADLDSRVISEGYDAAWVEEAKKKAGSIPIAQLPVRAKLLGIAGIMNNTTPVTAAGQIPPQPGDSASALVQIIHAVYLTTDEDGVSVAYCTTFHKDIKGGDRVPAYARHETTETLHGELLYVPLVREWRARSITASRSVPEMVSTQQKLIKDVFDGIVDRNSITIAPPVNIYESPAGVKYDFGAFAQNYVKQGREPQFMQLPSQAGMVDGVKVLETIRSDLAHRFGLMRGETPPTLVQLMQERDARRFLVAWTCAFQQVLALWQQRGDDAEFARITGAPQGWLEERRNQTNLLTAVFDFDVRELDSEQFIEQVKAMNTVVMPNDVLGVIERGNYAAWMAQGIVGPRVAKRFVRPVNAASGALREQAELVVLKMFAGTPPKMLDKDDPTAAGLLDYTIKTVSGNPKYLMALNDEALMAVAGPQAQQLSQQLPQRQPDELFSGLLLKWIENLKFIGVTQQRNKQIGRQGVDGGQQEG